jgi:hypothetical protein
MKKESSEKETSADDNMENKEMLTLEFKETETRI